MSADGTPKLSTIRSGWVKGHPFPLTTETEEREAEFDRAISERDREVAAKAWEEAADICQRVQDDPAFLESGPGVVAAKIVIRARAVEIRNGEHQ